MNKCKECGQDVFDGAKFCYDCGASIIGLPDTSDGPRLLIKTTILTSTSKTNTSSAVGRGVVGGVIAGPVGAIVGAGTAKNNDSVVFLLEYSDGTTETKSVEVGSWSFDMYSKYLSGRPKNAESIERVDKKVSGCATITVLVLSIPTAILLLWLIFGVLFF